MLKEIKNRRSVREFRPEMPSEKDILEIIKAGQFAPSANGVHALEFIVVKDQDIKDRIFEIVGQEFTKDAPVLIIPLCDAAETEYSVHDISVATENMFLAAEAFGLGTVWKNLQLPWQAQIKKLLGIPENYALINLFPLGYPKSKPVPHADEDFNTNVVHQDHW